MIDSRAFFGQKSSVYFQEMQDAFLKHQRIVVMKLKRVSQLTLGLFFASQLFYTAQAAPPKNQQPPNIMIILDFQILVLMVAKLKPLISIAC